MDKDQALLRLSIYRNGKPCVIGAVRLVIAFVSASLRLAANRRVSASHTAAGALRVRLPADGRVPAAAFCFALVSAYPVGAAPPPAFSAVALRALSAAALTAFRTFGTWYSVPARPPSSRFSMPAPWRAAVPRP
jgi:hypothetical protein